MSNRMSFDIRSLLPNDHSLFTRWDQRLFSYHLHVCNRVVVHKVFLLTSFYSYLKQNEWNSFFEDGFFSATLKNPFFPTLYILPKAEQTWSKLFARYNSATAAYNVTLVARGRAFWCKRTPLFFVFTVNFAIFWVKLLLPYMCRLKWRHCWQTFTFYLVVSRSHFGTQE